MFLEFSTPSWSFRFNLTYIWGILKMISQTFAKNILALSSFTAITTLLAYETSLSSRKFKSRASPVIFIPP